MFNRGYRGGRGEGGSAVGILARIAVPCNRLGGYCTIISLPSGFGMSFGLRANRSAVNLLTDMRQPASKCTPALHT